MLEKKIELKRMKERERKNWVDRIPLGSTADHYLGLILQNKNAITISKTED